MEVKKGLTFCLLLAAITYIEASDRVVGGEYAEEGQFPYQVAILENGSQFCGGSILDETTILTAAHCLIKQNPSDVTILAGTTSLTNGGESYKVARLIPHDSYKKRKLGYDIGLIKLQTPIAFTPSIQPVKLPTSDDFGGERCILSGWGRDGMPGIYPDGLKWVELVTIPIDDCMEFNKLVGLDQVCTQMPEGKGTCNGDSGGPLVDMEGNQIGLVSWGIPCATGRPDMYTRVYYFLDWIAENRT